MIMLINDYEMELFCPPCDPGSEAWVANVQVDADLGELMPYMNAVVENGYYDPGIPTLLWKEGAHKFVLQQRAVAINNLHDRNHAERKVKKLIDNINETWEKRSAITPDTTTRTPPKVLDVFKLLPRTNCKECGVPSCMAFAAALAQGDKCVDECPALQETQNKEILEKLRDMGL
jgi:ArsR family metal-binding transcriptional regulator